MVFQVNPKVYCFDANAFSKLPFLAPCLNLKMSLESGYFMHPMLMRFLMWGILAVSIPLNYDVNHCKKD